MTKHAKVPILALAILSILAVPLIAEAGGKPEDANKATVFASRGDHATISFGTQESVSIELRGRLFDEATNRPLRDTAIEVVRFELEGSASTSEVSIQDVAALPYSAKAVVEKTTAGQGDFVLSDLAPGRYSLQVAWDDVPAESDVVRWDLHWVEKPAAAQGK
ncbi:MAG TPA: hypothetical protein VJG13_06735 [Thermoanaerobaculia bacterium]|nr:hypothetical protein [Thermoanaerobaculia bacterium]